MKKNKNNPSTSHNPSPSPVKTNRRGVSLIRKHEGFRPTAYRDAAGLPTIGYGHLIKKGENFGRLSEKEAAALLRADLNIAEAAVARYVKVKLSANQHAAIVSWVFNLGAGALRNSTMLKRINDGELHRVPGEMMRWVIAGGRPLKGLIKRRADEATLFLS